MKKPKNLFGAKYICIEGSEGVGKTTQVSNIVSYLRDNNYKVLETKEPGTAHLEVTKSLRNIVLDSKYEKDHSLLSKDLINIINSEEYRKDMTNSAKTWLLEALSLIEKNKGMAIYARELVTQAIRNIHLVKLIGPSLYMYDYIIQDRGILSGFAYGEACGVDSDFMKIKSDINVKEANLCLEYANCYDQIIYLYGNVSSNLKRALASKKEFETGDAMENRGHSFLDKVNENFNKYSKEFQAVNKINVDNKDIDTIFKDIIKVLI